MMAPPENPSGCPVPSIVENSCCGETPGSLTATFHDVVGCSELEDFSVSISFDSTLNAWYGVGQLCGKELNVTMYCGGSGSSGFGMHIEWGPHPKRAGECIDGEVSISAGGSCGPPVALEFEFADVEIRHPCPCCDGENIDFFVSVTG